MKYMGKKLFGLLLAFAMTAAMMPLGSVVAEASELVISEAQTIKASELNAQGVDSLSISADVVLELDENLVLTSIRDSSESGVSLTIKTTEPGSELLVSNNEDYPFYVSDLTLENAIVTVESSYSNENGALGIGTDDLKVNGGTLSVSQTGSGSYGIFARGVVQIAGGAVVSSYGTAVGFFGSEIKVGSSTLEAGGNEVGIWVEKELKVSGDTANVSAEASGDSGDIYGVYAQDTFHDNAAPANITVLGGELSAATGGDAQTGTAIYASGDISVSGGLVSAYSQTAVGAGIESEGNMTFTGGQVIANAPDMGLYAIDMDSTITIQGAATAVSASVTNTSDPESAAVFATKDIVVSSPLVIRVPDTGVVGEASGCKAILEGSAYAKTAVIHGGGYVSLAGEIPAGSAPSIDGAAMSAGTKYARMFEEEVLLTIAVDPGIGVKGSKATIGGSEVTLTKAEDGTYSASFAMPAANANAHDAEISYETVNVYTVEFETGSGSTVPSQTVESGKTATEPAAPTLKGYTFDGWYLDAEYANAFSFNTAITQNTKLYAKWAPVTYEVAFNSNGGTTVATQKVENGKTAERPTDPKKTGYSFEGWYTDSALTKVFDFNTPITSNVTLYAKWEKSASVTYTIITGGNGTWTKGSTSEYVIRVRRSVDDDKCLDHFQKVMIGKTTLTQGTDYTVESGSTIVRVKSTLMQRLTVAPHEIDIIFDDGQATAKVTVKSSSNSGGSGSSSSTTRTSTTSAKTGVEDYMGLWMAMLLCAAAVIAAVTYSRKRSRK